MTHLMGITEIAELAGVKRQVVANWKKRDPTFPAPAAELAMGPVYLRPTILKWLHQRRAARTETPSLL